MFNARRSKSCQRPARAASRGRGYDEYGSSGTNGNDGDEDMGDLRETIAHLKESVMTHANSSAESMEQFANLQLAHDTLYGDYTRLQEQMDDAVELLKYLKEEKTNYEGKVTDMNAELEVLRKESKNIATLNATNSQLSTKIETLEKSNKEARASLTKQQLEYETTLSNFLKERGELLDKVKGLEQASTSRENKKVEDLNSKLATSLEKIAQLQRERRILSLSQTNDASSTTNALMEKLNERIEHLERDNRELLQETKDMKLYVTTMEEALMKKDDQAEAAENEFQNEKEELQQHLVSFQEQIAGYQQQHESLQQQIQKSQQLDQSRQAQQLLHQQQVEDRHKGILLENESLKQQLQELQDVVEEQSNASRQYSAHLEKEMQDRLAQRIAVQLQDSKLSMEAQIREELESEYMTKQQEMIASYGNENLSDLESKLREELLQVKGERERWKSEQEDLMKRVRESQQQFESVREGFKKKLEKEKNRCKELERQKEGQEIVIEKMSEEYHDVMNELKQLQAQEGARMQSLLEKEKSSLLQQHLKQIEDLVRREEEYTLQIRKLRNEIEELLNEQTSHMHEQNRWEEEKQSLLAKCTEKDDELRRAMDDLEELNSENAEYLQKIEVYTNSMDSFEESRVKYSVLQIEHKQLTQKLSRQEEQNETLTRQLEQLNNENGDLQQRTTELTSEVNNKQLEIDKLQQSLKESGELCSKVQSELSSIRKDEEEVQKGFHQSAPNLSSDGLGVGIENAVKDSAEVESRHRKIVDELQARISDSTSQISKLIDQLSIFSDEKSSLMTKLESATLELSVIKEKAEISATKVSQLEASIELLTAERDAATSLLAEVSTGTVAFSSTSNEKMELMSVIDEKSKEILSVEAEKVQALAKVSDLEDIVKELQDKSACLAAELVSSKSESSKLLSQLELANRLPIKDERNNDLPACMLDSIAPNVIEDYEAKIIALQSEIENLKGGRELTSVEADDLHASYQITIDKDQKSNTDMIQLRDNNVILQEAIQDIQVDKEDLEKENEELASKLADLTTQAKMLLLTNEELEEAISDQQIEYEERIAELEGMLAGRYESDGLILMGNQAKSDLSELESSKGNDNEHFTCMDDVHLKLGQIIDSSSEVADPVNAIENRAVTSDDVIVPKESSLTTLMQKKTQFDSASRPTSEFDDSTKHEETKAETPFINDQIIASDRHAADHRPYAVMDLSDSTQTVTILSAAAKTLSTLQTSLVPSTVEQLLVPAEANDIIPYQLEAGYAEGEIVTTNNVLCAPSTDSHGSNIEEQVKKLIVENGKLAQRLGNAVADKEFAVNTLSKLGAKMEELMERNRKLSNLAGLTSKHPSLGSSYHSMERGRDPVNVTNTAAVSYCEDIEPIFHSSSPVHDDQSAYSFSGSTILTYESLKKLEPESSYSIAGKGDDDVVSSPKRNTSGRSEGKGRSVINLNIKDPSNEITSPDSTHRVKFPGGEYIGSLNRRGQKHGSGKMKYDNGNEYDGEWMNDKRAGKGTTKYSSGNVYIGAWKAGKRHGFGVFHIKKTGDIYRGNWAHGLKSGPGVYEYEDGELDISYYKDDVRVGVGVRWSASRHQASRLMDGQLVGEEGDMPFQEATKLTKQLGFIV